MPLEISIHYDDHDLEGTFPEALSLAYQDDKGAWHMQKAIDLDKEKKTIAVSTTHFSIWSGTTTLKLSPSKATVRVGEKVSLSLTDCDESLFGRSAEKVIGLLDRLIHGEDHPCEPRIWKVLNGSLLKLAQLLSAQTAPAARLTAA